MNNATYMKFLKQEDLKRKEAAKWLQDPRGAVAGKQRVLWGMIVKLQN